MFYGTTVNCKTELTAMFTFSDLSCATSARLLPNILFLILKLHTNYSRRHRPNTGSMLGFGRCFSVAGPTVCNSLPVTLNLVDDHACDTGSDTFRRLLSLFTPIFQVQHVRAIHRASGSSSSSSTTVGSMPVGVWRHSYYRCPPLPI